MFDGGFDGLSCDKTIFVISSGGFEEKFGFARHFNVVDVLFAEPVGSDESLVGVNDVFLMFEIRGLIHEDFDGLCVV